MSSLVGALGNEDATMKSEDLKDENDDFTATETGNGSDSEVHEEAVAQDEEMQDLFGEDEATEDVKHDRVATPASSERMDGISSPERKHREAMEYAEDDEPDQVVQQVTEATAQLPNIPLPRSSDNTHWVIRMPNFIKLDSKPFHPDTYVGPEQEDDDTQHGESSREKSMSIKLKVENTVRWRWSKDASGQERRKSNARVVRWSDGTLSLQLGKELFDITQTIDNSGTLPRQSYGNSQSQNTTPQIPQSSSSSSLSGVKPQGQGLTYLVAQHKRAGILQCEAAITGYMGLRPTGMQSETHRMLVRAVGQKHNKVARLRMAPDPTTDPEREVQELMKMASKKPRKPKGEDSLLGSRGKRSGYNRKRSGDDMWSDDEEEDAFGGGSEDEFGGDALGSKRRKGEEENKRRGPGEYLNDDFLVADSDEGDFGDSDDGARKRKKSRKTRDTEAEEDDLEKLEAKIEADERKRKQHDDEGDLNEGGAGDDAMDVESEEDEQEHRVRRAGAGSRKRRAVEFDEEEE